MLPARRALLPAVVALLLAGANDSTAPRSPLPPHLAGGTCAPADARSARAVRSLRQIVVDTSTPAADLRAKFELNGIDTSRITLIADEAVCVRAQAGAHASRPTRPTGLPVHVIAMGPHRFGVTDSLMISEDHFLMLTDTTFRELIAIRF